MAKNLNQKTADSQTLGMGGAFTAVADDATAASWNPGGLIQLERPEASFVTRLSYEEDRHHSGDDDFLVDRDSFDGMGLNYLSVVYPFRFLSRNWVVSLNYQEAYDFTRRFSASQMAQSSSQHEEADSTVYYDTQHDHLSEAHDDGSVDVDIVTELRTRSSSALRQLLSSELISSLSFEQEGLIDAISPAVALEVTPRVSVGVTANFYRDDFRGQTPIQSRTTAAYSGTSDSDVVIETDRTTTGSYTYTGTAHFPPAGGFPIGIDVDFEGSGTVDEFSETTTSTRQDQLAFEGELEEINDYQSIGGVNATLGIMCALSRRLGFGFVVDTPWDAEGSQTRTVRNTVLTYDLPGQELLDQTTSEVSETGDVVFHFPLYWAAGMVMRWNNRFHTTLDVSQTLWSDFWYQVSGAGRVNPLDGTPDGEHPIRDCWGARAGAEYLWVLAET